MVKPLVSVVIPCFNAERWLRQALRSVLEPAVEAIEVIVVDDGSSDSSRDIVRGEFPGVRLVRTPNGGPSAARNVGTSLASGEFLQYLDADDMLVPGKIAAQVRALEQTGADVAYGGWQRLVERPNSSFEPGEVVARQLVGPADVALFTDFWCPPAAYLFRRGIVERVGGWNERLPVIQDARFVLDCALHGGRFAYCPGVMAYYRVHSHGSVSSRDPVAFVRDCFRNAQEVETWWSHHGGVTPERATALVSVYAYVARASFERDRPTFDAALTALSRWEPRYVPAEPWRLRMAARLLGFRGAVALASLFHRIEGAVGRGLRHRQGR